MNTDSDRTARAIAADTTGPRYTSYPTADRFGPSFGAADYARALQRRADAPLALYVHVPFCASVCYYCACNKVITRHPERADAYLDALQVEIDLHARALGGSAVVSQLHLGGGTPTFLDDRQLGRLVAMLQSAFTFVPGAERAIEIDPRTVDEQRLRWLAALGFDRISLGVQDVDPDVQRAVNRVQPAEQVAALVQAARRIGFESINIDLICGLPRQTPESFARTLASVREMRPDRLALYAYAHLPERFKPQRRIQAAELPAAPQRLQMLGMAVDTLLAAGYVDIGMDHFALADDALAVAKRQGRLHRNFQGYATAPPGDLIGLGVSAIGQVGDCYVQNEKTLPEYLQAMSEGRFATARGLQLNADDRLRRDVVMSIMCRGRVDLPAVEAKHGIVFDVRFAPELHRLQALEERGWVQRLPGAIQVTPEGWSVVRAVAMVFDRYLHDPGERRATFSRIA